MARSHLRHVIRDKDGRAVQNARADVYLAGSTTPVADIWNAATGGSAVTFLVSNAQGEIEAWVDAPKVVDIRVSDNDATAYLSGSPASLLTWSAFTEAVDVPPPPAEIAQTDAEQTFTATQTFAGALRVSSGKPWFDVTAYGAVGDDSGDQSGAIQAAIDAANAAGGGIVFVPGGVYRCLSTVTLKENVHLVGAGMGGTELSFPTDLGTGFYAVNFSPATFAGLVEPPTLRDILIRGPGSYSLGTRTSNMDGIRMGSHMHAIRVAAYGFGAGFVMVADHNYLDACHAAYNYYGVLFPAAPLGGDNHYFFACMIHTNSFANVAVAGDNFISQGTFIACQMGSAPYAFYKFGTNTAGFLLGCTFTNVSFEAIGNAIVLDESTGGTGESIIDTTFERCYYISTNTDWRITARSFDYSFNVRSMRNVRVTESHFPLTKKPVGGVRAWQATSIDASCVVEGEGPPVPAGEFANVAGMRYEGGYNLENVHAQTVLAVGTISRGDILAWANSYTVTRMTPGGRFAGVAFNDATGGTAVVVALPGSVVHVLCESVPESGYPITPYQPTHHRGAVERPVLPSVNLLTANQASMETDTTGWAVDTNVTIARSTSQSHDGIASLELTAVGAGTMYPLLTPNIPITPTAVYQASIWFRPNTTARSVNVILSWVDGSGGFISNSTASGSEVGSSWINVTLIAAPPSNARYVRLVPQVLSAAAGEKHFVDTMSVVVTPLPIIGYSALGGGGAGGANCLVRLV